MLVLRSFWICRAEAALVKLMRDHSMRTNVQFVSSAMIVTIFLAACRPGSTADRADTSTTSAETVSIARRDSTATPTIGAGVVNAPTPPSADAKSESMPAQPVACTPTTFGPNDTLTLRMGTPHGDQLAIHSPDRTTYSLVYPTLGKPRRNYSLIPSEEFRNVATFRVAPDVRAIPQIYGRDTTLEPVFTQPGKYLIVMGENLASEEDHRRTYCTVTFLPGSKE